MLDHDVDPREAQGTVLGAALWGLLLVIFGSGMGGIAYLRAAPPPEPERYVGSARCAPCHRSIHSAWSGSQHTKMMRPVDEPGALVADFTSPEAPLSRSDAVWAIGGKWEQQFMGHDGEGETLLPGAWHVGSERWETKGWDGWDRPVPLVRCHGCHTVGLDVETGCAFGLPGQVLRRGAGWANQTADPTRSGLGSPWGRFPYGDYPEDQTMINRGTSYCECMGY